MRNLFNSSEAFPENELFRVLGMTGLAAALDLQHPI
jgi:hypothetical protein